MAAITATAGILLLPAIYNRFPMLFPDTSAYLDVAFSDAWTLDRSGFYGLALKPFVTVFEPVAALWTGLAVQLLAIAAILIAATRRVWPHGGAAASVGIVAMVALLSSLPWHAAQLMPDAFAGPLVLVTWLAASRNVAEPGTPLLWLAAVLMALFHFTYLAIAPAVALITLAAAWRSGVAVHEVGKRLLVLIVAVAAVSASHVAVNGSKFDRWEVSPMGSMFLFARLYEDGLVQP